jgi:hypothetical protein
MIRIRGRPFPLGVAQGVQHVTAAAPQKRYMFEYGASGLYGTVMGRARSAVPGKHQREGGPFRHARRCSSTTQRAGRGEAGASPRTCPALCWAKPNTYTRGGMTISAPPTPNKPPRIPTPNPAITYHISHLAPDCMRWRRAILAGARFLQLSTHVARTAAGFQRKRNFKMTFYPKNGLAEL